MYKRQVLNHSVRLLWVVHIVIKNCSLNLFVYCLSDVIVTASQCVLRFVRKTVKIVLNKCFSFFVTKRFYHTWKDRMSRGWCCVAKGYNQHVCTPWCIQFKLYLYTTVVNSVVSSCEKMVDNQISTALDSLFVAHHYIEKSQLVFVISGLMMS